MKKPVIHLENIWKIYQIGDVKVEALRGVDMEIKPGEFVAISGPSGSGKSTMMNMVGALDVPTKGTILLDGKDIREVNVRWLRSQIGYVCKRSQELKLPINYVMIVFADMSVKSLCYSTVQSRRI